jgi:hypothetical protein
MYQFPSNGVIPQPTGPSAMISPDGLWVIRTRLFDIDGPRMLSLGSLLLQQPLTPPRRS